MNADVAVFGALLTLSLLIIVYVWSSSSSPQTPRRWRSPPPRARRRCGPREGYRPGPVPEPFEPQPAAAAVDLQSAIDFSDVMVPEAERTTVAAIAADAEQIQTIDERFRAAKRSVTEHKLKNGVYTTPQRRKLVEALLRRPQCGRRVRSWRTENGDFLRGDVIPRAQGGSTNLVRSAKNNPVADLHPGALGPMAGMQGQWLSEENIPENLFQDSAIAV